jgi:hypothetical protein
LGLCRCCQQQNGSSEKEAFHGGVG